tara:strand:- start:2419 stop:3102 length:684 start_codon:yes stop_codon:yes gene_type:complete
MISETACILEAWIDEYIDALQSNSNIARKNVKTLITANRVKPREAKKIAEHFQRLLDEVNSVLDETDEDLLEGWSYLNQTKIKRLHGYLETIVDEFKIKGTVTRRKKKISPQQMVKSVKYLTDHKNFGNSISPDNIIGAKGVLLFNTKQKKIAYYESKRGFTVKGTTLQGVDGGVVKSCGRKDSKWIGSLIGCHINRMINEINTLSSKEQELTGRINKDTLILRIVK